MSEERFELQPELTGVALAYRNKSLIADEIFPNVPVTLKSLNFLKAAKKKKSLNSRKLTKRQKA